MTVFLLLILMILTFIYSQLAVHKAYNPCKPLTQHEIKAEYPLLFSHI